MKYFKVIFLILLCYFFTGCSKNVENTNQMNRIEIQEKEEVIDIYEDKNLIKIGLYDNINGKYLIYKDYKDSFKPSKDINTFQIVFSDEEEVSYKGNRQDFIKSLWDDISYKFTLGIILEYDTINNGHIRHVIYSPDNTLENFDYFQVYLYDAIAHKNDKWYSHITKEEFNDNSYITSFKLTAGPKIEEVLFPVEISVFTYDSEDDFDFEGNYRGNSIYTIKLDK